MAKPKLLPANQSLWDCPKWPTSHTLPRPVVVVLEHAVRGLGAAGISARMQEVLGIVILVFAPDDPKELRQLMLKPHPQLKACVADLPAGRYRRRRGSGTEQLMVRLPSPVTLRLNLLVQVLHDSGFPASRRQVVSAVALHALPTRPAPLVEAFEQYRAATAGKAAVTGHPRKAVLSLQPPPPGRRPMR